MENNGTTSAQAPSTQPARFRPVRSFLAVCAGVMTDLGGTNIVAICYALVIAVPLMRSLAGQGLSQSEMVAQLSQSLDQATRGSIVVIGFGIVLSILGGFVAGKKKGAAEGVPRPASGRG